MAVKISRDDVVALCKELGWATADRWDKKRTERKFAEVIELFRDDSSILDDAEDKEWASKVKVLLAKIVEDGKFTIVLDEPVEDDVKQKPKKVKAKALDDDDEEDEDEDGEDEIGEDEADEDEADEDEADEEEVDEEEVDEEEVEELRVKKAKQKKERPPKQKKERPPKRKKGLVRLRAAGQVLRQEGMTDDTFKLDFDRLIPMVDQIAGSENEIQSRAALNQAWSSLVGYWGL